MPDYVTPHYTSYAALTVRQPSPEQNKTDLCRAASRYASD